MQGSYCKEILLEELSNRKARNSLYSLRAFARDLGIGSTSLSDVLASKRKFSIKNIIKMADKLNLTPLQIDLLLAESNETEIYQSKKKEKIRLKDDIFRLVSDWYYFAILNLSKVPNNKADPVWVGKRLGITEFEAEAAINRLIRLGFLKIKRGRLERIPKSLSTTREVPSRAIRKHHRENLKLAKLSLERDPIELREFSSITMAIDPKNLKRAKDILMRTKSKLAKMLETKNPKEVYVLSYQLFPVSRRSKNNKGNK